MHFYQKDKNYEIVIYIKNKIFHNIIYNAFMERQYFYLYWQWIYSIQKKSVISKLEELHERITIYNIVQYIFMFRNTDVFKLGSRNPPGSHKRVLGRQWKTKTILNQSNKQMKVNKHISRKKKLHIRTKMKK